MTPACPALPTRSWLYALCLLAVLGAWPRAAVAAVIDVQPGKFDRALGRDFDVYVDTTNRMTVDDVRRLPDSAFFNDSRQTPNYSFTRHTYWLRIRVHWNVPAPADYLLTQEYPLTDFLTLYRPGPDGRYVASRTGDQFDFAQREMPVRAFGFPLVAKPGVTEDYYLSLHGAGTIYVDLRLASEAVEQASSETRHLLLGLYYGALLALLLYNLVLYATLRERMYLYYTVYVATLGITFFDLNGLAFRYLWPHWPAMNTWFLLFTYASLYALAAFAREFLSLRRNAPALDRVFQVCLAFNVLAFVSVGFTPTHLLFPMSQYFALVVAGLCLFAGVLAWVRGLRAARWFILGCGAYIAGIFTYVLQNLDVLPASGFANHAVQIGSAIEMAVLSLALADRIRLMKQERAALAESAHRSLLDAKEHLERRVAERTAELRESLSRQQEKHDRLVAMQQQLVQAEKMSSLGALVAGVAHEMNNPANFTRIAAGNIARDIDRLHDFLRGLADAQSDAAVLAELEARFAAVRDQIALVNDGTERLARIVKDLRFFSRQDDSALGIARPDDGLVATLNLVRAQYGGQVDIVLRQRDPDAAIPCQVAALNQVFMNLAVNACQAMLDAPRAPGARGVAGHLEVESGLERGDGVEAWTVRFRDDGPGMTEDVRQRVFEPFFTTKPVGEGTGLGLSVSYGIIRKHGGDIRVESSPGRGTCFTLRLPLAGGTPAFTPGNGGDHGAL